MARRRALCVAGWRACAGGCGCEDGDGSGRVEGAEDALLGWRSQRQLSDEVEHEAEMGAWAGNSARSAAMGGAAGAMGDGGRGVEEGVWGWEVKRDGGAAREWERKAEGRWGVGVGVRCWRSAVCRIGRVSLVR